MTTWLEADHWDDTPMGERFQALLDRPGIIKAPGAHNAMAGLLAKAAGFDCLYVSGAAVTETLSRPSCTPWTAFFDAPGLARTPTRR